MFLAAFDSSCNPIISCWLISFDPLSSLSDFFIVSQYLIINHELLIMKQYLILLIKPFIHQHTLYYLKVADVGGQF